MRLSFVLCVVVSAACSTVRVRVPVMRPAEINLRGKQELVIGEVRGPASPEVGNLLKDAIVGSGRFKLVDRQHMDKVMGELQLSQSDLADVSQRRKLGKMMTGSIMVTASVESSDYRESTERRNETCTKTVNNKSVQYKCVKNIRRGDANVAVGFDVIDIETGENLKPKRLSCHKSTSAEAIDSPAPPVNGRPMLDQCHQEVVASFMKAIAPWQDYVNAPFLKKSDIPMLEVGINYAQRGEWSDAIAQFKSAVEFTDKQPGMSAELIAWTHWDLGLAYEYTFRFEEAQAEVKKAFEMTNEPDFLHELDNIKKLQADQEKLKEQTEAPGIES